jgi:hypothetical protein
LSIQQLNAIELRQRLAGLVDPGNIIKEEELQELKDEAVTLCMFLAEVYSEDLDRLKLWERIGNGLGVCPVKCGGDWELMIEGLLAYVKASPEVLKDKFLRWMNKIESKSAVWKEQFILTLEKRRYLIVANAREKWKSKKEDIRNRREQTRLETQAMKEEMQEDPDKRFEADEKALYE